MTTTPPPVPPLTLPAPEPAPTTPPNPWIARALGTAAATGIAAGYLVFDQPVGAGWAAFTLALIAAIASNRDRAAAISTPRLALLATLVLATAAQTVLRPSATAALVSALLAAYAAAVFLSPQRFPFVRTLLEGVTKILAAPLRPFQSVRHANTVGQAIRNTASPLRGRTANTRRALSVVVPASLVVLPFVVFLSLGNSILGDAFSQLFTYLGDAFYSFEPPSAARLAFVALVATLTLALLWRTNPSAALARITATLQKSYPAPADHSIALWRTILILAGVNAVFFAANTLDVIYLWAGAGLPEHLTLSEFVHHGTANLIISVLTAAGVLSLLFQQHHGITRATAVRNLAVAWIVQNLFLVSSVALRLHSYVDNYGLSLKRLYLFLFLTLVAAGFVLLTVRIVREKSFAWLVGANLTTLFALTFATQFWDARATVAHTNFTLAREWKSTHTHHLHIDTRLLADLGPSAWPVLIEIANGAAGFDHNEVANAQRRLDTIAATHDFSTTGTQWQSYSHHRHRTLAALRDYHTTRNTTARVTPRE